MNGLRLRRCCRINLISNFAIPDIDLIHATFIPANNLKGLIVPSLSIGCRGIIWHIIQVPWISVAETISL